MPPNTFFQDSSPMECAVGFHAYVSSLSVPEYTLNDECPLAKKYGNIWSTCTGISVQPLPLQR
jgi:hypothetical protein